MCAIPRLLSKVGIHGLWIKPVGYLGGVGAFPKCWTQGDAFDEHELLGVSVIRLRSSSNIKVGSLLKRRV